MPRGRPKLPNQVRVNWRVNRETKMRVQARVVKSDPKRNTPGKVIDEAFKDE